MSLRQVEQLKRQRAYAWSRYYKECNERHEAVIEIMNKIPEHLVKELEELTIALGKEIECPICMCAIPKGELKITCCGHKFCNTCASQMKEMDEIKRREDRDHKSTCPICRKNVKW